MNKATITLTPDTDERIFKQICEGFRKKYQEDFEFIRINDARIIGGFIADFNGEVYDASIKSRLNSVAKHIGKVAL